MTWDAFYERFFDLSFRTQKAYSYKLTDYGPADEVFEVLSEFVSNDRQFATRFAEKALNAGVHFTPEQVLEMTILIDKPVLSRMAETSVPSFDREQLEEIYMLIEEDSFERIAKKQKIDIFTEEKPEEDLDEEFEDNVEFVPAPEKKIGFLPMLMAAIASVDIVGGSKRERRIRRCNGDCAHCPPHYGYRYGRWYYGHDHQYGCEFGGNRGSSRND